jgi:hypothetical protein
MTPAGRDHPDIHVQHATAAAQLSRFRSGRSARASVQRKSPIAIASQRELLGTNCWFPCVARATAHRSTGAPTGASTARMLEHPTRLLLGARPRLQPRLRLSPAQPVSCRLQTPVSDRPVCRAARRGRGRRSAHALCLSSQLVHTRQKTLAAQLSPGRAVLPRVWARLRGRSDTHPASQRLPQPR